MVLVARGASFGRRGEGRDHLGPSCSCETELTGKPGPNVWLEACARRIVGMFRAYPGNIVAAVLAGRLACRERHGCSECSEAIPIRICRGH